MSRKSNRFAKVMLAVLMSITITGLIARIATSCRAGTEMDRERAFCIQQGYADVQYWINEDYCIGYRDGVLIVASIAKLEAREE